MNEDTRNSNPRWPGPIDQYSRDLRSTKGERYQRERYRPNDGSPLHAHEHPDTHVPWQPWEEENTLHVAVAYSNPFRYWKRRELTNDCRRHLESTANVRVYVGELAYGDRPHEVTGEHPNDVQFRTFNELWHKENLLNRTIERFPVGWKYGAYVDGDFHFTRQDWAIEAIHLLQHYDFVQLFSSYADLSNNHRPHRLRPSFAWQYVHREEFKLGLLNHRGEVENVDCYGVKLAPGEYPHLSTPGATGGAWAFRKDAFETVGQLMDRCILGSADWHMAFGLAGQIRASDETKRCSPSYIEYILEWQRRARELKRGIGCVDQFAVHHFHGSKTRRAYGERWHILKQADYNPYTDLMPDARGIFQLGKASLKDPIRRYFLERSEDDPNLAPTERELV